MQRGNTNGAIQSSPIIISDPQMISDEGVYMIKVKLNNVDQLKSYLKNIFQIIDSIGGEDVRENALKVIAASDSIQNSRFGTAVGLLFCKKRSESTWILAHEAAQMNQIDTNMLNFYSGLLAESGGPNLALPLLRWLYVADPNNTYTLNNLGFSFRQLLQPDSAYNYFQLAIKADHTNGMAHYNKVCGGVKNIPDEIKKAEIKEALKYSFSDEMYKDAESMGIEPEFNDINWPFPFSNNAISLFNISKYDYHDLIDQDCDNGQKEDLAKQDYNDFFDNWINDVEKYNDQIQIDSMMFINEKSNPYKNIMARKINIFLKALAKNTESKQKASKIATDSFYDFVRLQTTEAEKQISAIKCLNLPCGNNEGEKPCPCPCEKFLSDATHNIRCKLFNVINNNREEVETAWRAYANAVWLQNYFSVMYSGLKKSNIDARIKMYQPGAAKTFFLDGDFHQTETHEHAEKNCTVHTIPKTKFDPPVDSDNPFCYLPEFSLGIGIVKVDLKCEALEISGEDGIAWKVKKEIDKKGNWADLELAIGAGVGWKFGAKLGGDNGVGFEADAKIADYMVVRFDDNLNLKDIGFKAEAKASANIGGVKAQVKGEGAYYANAGGKFKLGIKEGYFAHKKFGMYIK
jgi:hypothetical protein